MSGTRLSLNGLRILRIFVVDPGARLSGYAIAKRIRLPSAIVYGLLATLKKQGLLQAAPRRHSPWEPFVKRMDWTITAAGRDEAERVLAELRVRPPRRERAGAQQAAL